MEPAPRLHFSGMNGLVCVCVCEGNNSTLVIFAVIMSFVFYSLSCIAQDDYTSAREHSCLLYFPPPFYSLLSVSMYRSDFFTLCSITSAGCTDSCPQSIMFIMMQVEL